MRSRIVHGTVLVAIAAASPVLLGADTPASVAVNTEPSASRAAGSDNPAGSAAKRRASRSAKRSSRATARRSAPTRKPAPQRKPTARRTATTRPVTGTQHRPSADGLNWAALAQCESGNNPRAIGGGGAYRGLYQFMLSTWRSVGGVGDPINASRGEQTYRAQLLYRRSGAGQWGACGRRLFT